MTTLEIMLSIVIGLIFPGVWYLQKRINDIERDYASRNEFKTEIKELKRDMEKDMEEIKAALKEINDRISKQ